MHDLLPSVRRDYVPWHRAISAVPVTACLT